MNTITLTESESFGRQQKRGFTVQEAAAYTSLSKQYLRNMIRSGDLKVKRFGRRVVILSEFLEEFMQSGKSA